MKICDFSEECDTPEECQNLGSKNSVHHNYKLIWLIKNNSKAFHHHHVLFAQLYQHTSTDHVKTSLYFGRLGIWGRSNKPIRHDKKRRLRLNTEMELM